MLAPENMGLLLDGAQQVSPHPCTPQPETPRLGVPRPLDQVSLDPYTPQPEIL
jgi:hypothetical protein